jgi:hypothetical protein
MRDGDEFPRMTVATAAEACQGRTLSPEAAALLADGQTLRAYLDALAAAGHFSDAEVLLAHCLPRREAVWWACQCVRAATGPGPAPEVEAAIRAAETWAAAPGDLNRRRAYPVAEAVGFGHPAGGVALAAFFSGGSLAPPELPAVPPADHLTGDTVAAAVQIAALTDPARSPERHRSFLELGLDVARGKSRWKDNL